ncbi:MAG: hypothetical protein LBI28_11780 [Treponema sp.]|jgi:hypothetical protein|nr:hypothetical protein [Treponema sp.]
MSVLEDRLANYGDYFPSCMDYAELLARIVKKEKIAIEKAREKYGSFSYRQWEKI